MAVTPILPGKPFTTKDFSSPGGGVDFLGLRLIGLSILGEHLIPQLNNQTFDMGMFCLAGWIPWKFRQLCTSEANYTEKNYRLFREKVEVALSLTFSDESKIDHSEGHVRRQVGSSQKPALPGPLTFKSFHRSEQNSLYAAPLYGPAVYSLGFIASYRSRARPGQPPVNVPVAGKDPDIVSIIQTVDECLRQAGNYEALASLSSSSFGWEDIRTLGEAGLDPALYRAARFRPLKQAFARRLLPLDPIDPGYPRTLTARLILQTIGQETIRSTDDLRAVWYTGLFPNGAMFQPRDPVVAQQRENWSVLLASQYQRYAIELLLCCFEDALRAEARTIEEIVEHWVERTPGADAGLPGTLRDMLKVVAGNLWVPAEHETARAWCNTVHVKDERFEYVDSPLGDSAVLHALRMFAGWYWRMLDRVRNPSTKDLLDLGGADRMGVAWFFDWLRQRLDRPIRDLLRDLFANLIFAQHMRIAILRFDTNAQRLRFQLGDNGIEPTKAMGQLGLPWMADRLDTLVSLLRDCGILDRRDDAIRSGSNADIALAQKDE